MPNSHLPRILVIDDSLEIARLLHTLLSDMADISVANTGARGLEVAGKLRPDLILLDMELPDINGLQVCAALKREPVLADIPVLFVTAGNSTEAELAALAAGAVDYLVKPLRPQIVRARINTHLKLSQQARRLEQLVHMDGLTGVFNRRYLDAALRCEIAKFDRYGGELTIAMIDVDHFKAYNDALGHVQGDHCLREVAQALTQAMRRPGEILARYGGEEFLVVAPGLARRDAARFGDWLCGAVAALALAHPASPVGPHVTVSVGLACCTRQRRRDADALVAAADGALYLAKQAGRARCHVAAED